jgi:hypothetical protein
MKYNLRDPPRLASGPGARSGSLRGVAQSKRSPPSAKTHMSAWLILIVHAQVHACGGPDVAMTPRSRLDEMYYASLSGISSDLLVPVLGMPYQTLIPWCVLWDPRDFSEPSWIRGVAQLAAYCQTYCQICTTCMLLPRLHVTMANLGMLIRVFAVVRTISGGGS